MIDEYLMNNDVSSVAYWEHGPLWVVMEAPPSALAPHPSCINKTTLGTEVTRYNTEGARVP